ncbi:hypothetical protein PIB30_088434 [Stylosanthes scabra]|uniref:Uncharacterized protein n=1 Tax=Stylosanthes scabra TaxID=79078 RepID=A0ABU6RUK9_9FABA|nr:hypothetical protein [Stylosanthes scabra]
MGAPTVANASTIFLICIRSGELRENLLLLQMVLQFLPTEGLGNLNGSNPLSLKQRGPKQAHFGLEADPIRVRKRNPNRDITLPTCSDDRVEVGDCGAREGCTLLQPPCAGHCRLQVAIAVTDGSVLDLPPSFNFLRHHVRSRQAQASLTTSPALVPSNLYLDWSTESLESWWRCKWKRKGFERDLLCPKPPRVISDTVALVVDSAHYLPLLEPDLQLVMLVSFQLSFVGVSLSCRASLSFSPSRHRRTSIAAGPASSRSFLAFVQFCVAHRELPRVVRICVVAVSPSCVAIVRLKLCLATR